MDILVGLLILGGLAALLQSLWKRRQVASSAARLRTNAVIAARRRNAERQRQERIAHQQRELAARNFQLAILQIRQSPDFRRAASFAAAARSVPAEFRQRQFRRLRSLLVNHLAERLRQGAAVENAAAGLTDLVVGLGIPDYEADYVLQEATARMIPRSMTAAPAPRFEDQVQQWQSQHQQRMETLRSLALDSELKEQLLEQEETRFRDQLLAAGETAAGAERINI